MSENNGAVKDALEQLDKAFYRIREKLLASIRAQRFILNSMVTAFEKETEAARNSYEILRTLEDCLKNTGINTAKYFESILFLDLISEVEYYFSDLIKIVVCNHPKKLGNISYKLEEIIDSASIDELVARASEQFVQKLMYKKPHEYLVDLCDILSIDKEALEEHWPIFIEAKARRDVAVHNNWICNRTYLRKLQEAKINTKSLVGDQLLPDDSDYFDNVTDGITEIVFIIHSSVSNKFIKK